MTQGWAGGLRRIALGLWLPFVAFLTPVSAQTSVPFLVNGGGAGSETTFDQDGALRIGYARIAPNAGERTPFGVAMRTPESPDS